MQDLKTGHLCHASPRAQFFGQLIGSSVSIIVTTTAYTLYNRAYVIPGPSFPAPTAYVWLSLARLLRTCYTPLMCKSEMLILSLKFRGRPIAGEQRNVHGHFLPVVWLLIRSEDIHGTKEPLDREVDTFWRSFRDRFLEHAVVLNCAPNWRGDGIYLSHPLCERRGRY